MPVPSLLTLEKPRMKRSKSEETIFSDQSERRVYGAGDDDDITMVDSLGSTRKGSNLICIVIAIFGIGFTAGQILPSLIELKKDTRWIGFNESSLPSIVDDDGTNPLMRPLIHDDIDVTSNKTSVEKTTTFPSSFDADVFSQLPTDYQTLFYLTVEEQANLLPPPDLDDEDTVALYSQKTYQKLQQKLQSKSGVFRICINGGSSSAGGGNVDYEDRFFVKFAHAMEARHHVTTEIIDRAHGDRNSMHSAMLGEAFFVPNVDLLIWEFSINDARDGPVEARNEFLLWLHKLIDVYEDDPPMVLLVYLWNQPFSSDEHGHIVSDVFHYHELLGAQYDFVLGHVNLATYLNSFQWPTAQLGQYFLGDKTHPGALAHAAIANLMVHFVTGHLQQIHYDMDRPETEFEWTCGDDMLEQWQILEIFQGDNSGMAKASFTAEMPRTTDLPHGMLVPHKEFLDGDVDYDYDRFATQRYGLAKPGRVDRHRGVALPCCDDGKLVFDLAAEPVSAIQLYLHATEGGVPGGDLGRRRRLSGTRDFDSIEILINDHHDYSHRIVFADDWDCILNKELFSQWISLDEKDKEFSDRISFCSNHASCDSDIHTLEHLVVF